MSPDTTPPAATGVLDFHNHLIPGVDDGAQTLEDSRAALEALRGEGVSTIITTPHFGASTLDSVPQLTEKFAELDRAWTQLAGLVRSDFSDLAVHRGVELRLDVPDPDLSDERVRLAGTPFVLVEFDGFTIPPHSTQALARLRDRGWIPIIAHPERYHNAETYADRMGAWRDAGAYLQVNNGSITSRHGPVPQRLARHLLERGWVDYLSSDYHARGHAHVRPAQQALLEMGAEEHVHLLMVTNPRRILSGQAPLPLPPLQPRRGLWRRLGRVFR